MRCKVSHSVTILDLSASSSHRYYKGYSIFTFRVLRFTSNASTNKCTQLLFNSKQHSKNVEFLNVSEINGPTSDSNLYLSTLNTTNTSTRSSNLLSNNYVRHTHIPSTRKNPTNSSTCAKDQILFSNCFTQQNLMYSLMMNQQGPKHVKV